MINYYLLDRLITISYDLLTELTFDLNSLLFTLADVITLTSIPTSIHWKSAYFFLPDEGLYNDFFGIEIL
jgi:hypothetical protein